MRILFTSQKAPSHLIPMLPFAKGLRARGHEVRVAALADLGPELAKHGLDHLVLDGPTEDERAVVEAKMVDVLPEKKGKAFMARMFMGLLPQKMLPSLMTALDAWRPDLIIRESTEFSALIAGEALGIRHIRFEIVNGESEESIASNYTAEIDALRAMVGLSPTHGGYLTSEPCYSAHPQILDSTPRINSQAPYRFRPPTPDRPEAPSRPDWLSDGGRPLVYVTFGTLAAEADQVQHVYAESLTALADLPVDVLLTTGHDAPPDLIAAVPSNVTVRPFVPQAEIFDHAQLLVCHGGSGTVTGALAAGVPMVIVPMFADQPDNARCIAEAGLGVQVSYRDLSSLSDAVVATLGDEALRARVASAAATMRALPTTEEALDRLIAGG